MPQMPSHSCTRMATFHSTCPQKSPQRWHPYRTSPIYLSKESDHSIVSGAGASCNNPNCQSTSPSHMSQDLAQYTSASWAGTPDTTPPPSYSLNPSEYPASLPSFTRTSFPPPPLVKSYSAPPRFSSPNSSLTSCPAKTVRGSKSACSSGWITEDSKGKNARGLIDSAIKLVLDIWPTLPHSQSPSAMLGANPSKIPTRSHPTSQSLPSSPYSPGQLHPFIEPLSQSVPAIQQLLPPSESLPIRVFVHELLRRSRTSQVTLQTAISYLEAARPVIKDSLKIDQLDGTVQDVPGSISREQDWRPRCSMSMPTSPAQTPPSHLISSTLSLLPTMNDTFSGPGTAVSPSSMSAVPPLADPRRTFLAALILASKFLHDKPYSNRAWARLSGLQPREVSRCERALGDALGWRLWFPKEADTVSSPLDSTILFDGGSHSTTSPHDLYLPSMPASPMSQDMQECMPRPLRYHATI